VSATESREVFQSAGSRVLGVEVDDLGLAVLYVRTGGASALVSGIAYGKGVGTKSLVPGRGVTARDEAVGALLVDGGLSLGGRLGGVVPDSDCNGEYSPKREPGDRIGVGGLLSDWGMGSHTRSAENLTDPWAMSDNTYSV